MEQLVDFAASQLGADVLIETDLTRSGDGGAGGLGVFARAPIAAGDVIFRVPVSACLTLANPALREDAEMLELLGALAREGPVCKLAAMVAVEAARRPTMLEPWLERWPAATEGSLGWADGGREWASLGWADGLGLAAVRLLHEQHLAVATRAWQAVLEPCALRAAAGEGGSAALARLSWPGWLYAFSMVLSRALDLRANGDESQLAIVPLIDMLNHTASATDSCAVRFERASQAFELVAAAPIGAGAELRICYGDKGNEELLACYGFALEANRHDRLGLVLPFGLPAEPPMVTMQKLAMLPSAFARALNLRATADGARVASVELVWDEGRAEARLPEEMVLLLRLCVLGAPDLPQLARVLEGFPVSADAEARAWAHLADACARAGEGVLGERGEGAEAAIGAYNRGLAELLAAARRLSERGVDGAADAAAAAMPPSFGQAAEAEDEDYY
jgi:hypothetical protein